MPNKIKTYKFISIAENNEESGKEYPYVIFNNKSRDILGYLCVHWKQYVLQARETSVWSTGCLRDVIDFIENEAKK